MKYFNLIIGVTFIVAFAGFLVTALYMQRGAPQPVACTMEAMICPDGTMVGRVAPSCEFAPCPRTATSTPDAVQVAINAHKDRIVVNTPIRGATITTPLMVTGSARGTWYFEGSFPIALADSNGNIIGSGQGVAQGDWMTNDFVPFTATIDFTLPTDTPHQNGTLILKQDNPSGLPQHEDTLEIPIIL